MEYIMKFYGTDWMAMGMTFLSLHCLGNKSKFGFIFGILANVSWMVFGMMAGSIASPIANVLFLCLNIRGLIKWRIHTKLLPETGGT